MSEKQLSRRDFLRSAAKVSAGAVVGAGLVSACQTKAQPTAIPPTAAPAAAAAATTAPAAAPAAQEAKRDINVCCVAPISGFIAADGIEMRNGVVMAVDEINANGGLWGHKLKYIEVDDIDSTGDQVPTAFHRAIDVEKADVIFSGYHLNSSPEFDICADAGVLYYNNNTQKAWTDRYSANPDKYWSIFQTDPNEEWYGGGFAKYLNLLVDTGQFVPPNGKTAAVLHGDDTYSTFIGTTFIEEAKKTGWEIVYVDKFTPGNVPDWGPMLSKVKDLNPSVLFTADYNPADNAAMIKQWVADPINALLYQQYGPSVPEYLELAGDAANGVIWATVLGFLPDALGTDWVKKYEEKFKTTPGYANAPGGYDQVYDWAYAVLLAGDPFDYKKIAKMTEQNIHRGVTGGYYPENHAGRCYPWQTNDPSLGQSHTIYQIQDKKQVLVFPPPYANGEYQTPPWMS
jgi:branched-chain amino acid transport system substrate-binding protein